MKKLKAKRKLWLDARTYRQWSENVRAARMRNHVETTSHSKMKCCVISVPRVLVAEKPKQRQEILNVINQTITTLAKGDTKVKLDFSKVEKIFPGGMLILLASLQLFTNVWKGRITARCPPHSLTAQLINHFGLADAFGVSANLSKPKASSVIDWQFLTGTKAGGEEVRELLNNYRHKTNAEIPEGLFAALTEGLTNVRHHAYTENSEVPAEFQKWWLFARYTEPLETETGSLFIAIYDMGVGIPSTMRSKLEKGEIILDLIDKVGQSTRVTKGSALDRRLLEEAVEYKRSQTGQPHRGNGLPEMREFASTTNGGRLHIVSGQAQYTFVAGKIDGHTLGFKEEFPGTLLLWSLPLKMKEITS